MGANGYGMSGMGGPMMPGGDMRASFVGGNMFPGGQGTGYNNFNRMDGVNLNPGQYIGPRAQVGDIR